MATKIQIVAILRDAANTHGVPFDLAHALISQESALNPYAVSKVGAMGLGQLMPATAASLGVADAFDPAQNLDGSMRYLASMIRQFGERSGVAAYNAGPGAVKKYQGVPPYAETAEYVRKIESRMKRSYRS